MNKKGFTLIELLGVILIISLLVLIVLPKITNSVTNFSPKIDKLTLNMIEDAAKLYIEDNEAKFKESLYDYSCVPLTELTDKEYLKEGIEISGKDITNTKTLKITYDSDYKIELVENNECIILDPGLYDENDVLLATWDELVEKGLDIESDFTSSTSPNKNILNSYGNKYKLVVGGSVTKIGDFAFYTCSRLIEIILPNSVTSIGSNAFADSGLTTITIPNSVISIGTSAFARCYELVNVTIKNGVKSIGDSAFYFCRNLTGIIIPSSVTSIGSNAFGYCRKINNMIVDENNNVYDSRENSNAIIETASNTLISGCKNTIIPSSVTSISSKAFYNSALTSIIIPSNVTSIGDKAFGYCNNLTTIIVDENNSVYDSRENSNAIIEKSSNTLVVGCNSTVIPSSVISIGDSAFLGSNLGSITIPNSVTRIGDTAFNSSNLTSITILGDVTNIGSSAFAYNRALTSITLPNSVISIGNNAFNGCTNLKTIYYSGTATGSPWGAPSATVVPE